MSSERDTFWTEYGCWRIRTHAIVWGSVALLVVALGIGASVLQAHWWEDHKTERGRGDTAVARVDQDHADTYEMPDTFGNIATKCVGKRQRAWVTTKGGIFITKDPRCKATDWEIENDSPTPSDGEGTDK